MKNINENFDKELTVKELKGDTATCERLLEMGFIKGETFKVIHALPFGDPYLVNVNNLFVALRERELECIVI